MDSKKRENKRSSVQQKKAKGNCFVLFLFSLRIQTDGKSEEGPTVLSRLDFERNGLVVGRCHFVLLF